jgi:hypothetical protein
MRSAGFVNPAGSVRYQQWGTCGTISRIGYFFINEYRPGYSSESLYLLLVLSPFWDLLGVRSC